MKRILWLNNHSCPKPGTIHIYNYNDLKADIMCYGLPDEIWFGHDLKDGMNGIECAKFVVEYCKKNDLDIPRYHTENILPVDADKIIHTLDCYHNSFIELHESYSYDCSFDSSYDPIEEYNKNKSIREKALCELLKK